MREFERLPKPLRIAASIVALAGLSAIACERPPLRVTQPVAQSTPTSPARQEQAQTAWKEFVSMFYPFSVEYPPSWTLTTYPGGFGISEAFVGPTVGGFRTNINISFVPGKGETLESFKEIADAEDARGFSIMGLPQPVIKSGRRLRGVLDGYDGLEVTGRVPRSAPRSSLSNYFTNLYVVRNTDGWMINHSWGTQGTTDFSIPEHTAFRRMLKSFKFTG